jgi:hypothetical protein
MIKSPLAPGPENPVAFARYVQAAQIEQAEFDPHAFGVSYEVYFTKM